MKRDTNDRQLADSATFGPLTRAGIDGGCLVCQELIAAHVDSRGVWLGCKGAKRNVPLILIPVDLAVQRADIPRAETPRARTVTEPRSTGGHGQARRTGRPALMVNGTRTPYVYEAIDRRRALPVDLPGAQLDALKVLIRSAQPLTVREVAEKAQHPKETTQQLLVALVNKRLARRRQA